MRSVVHSSPFNTQITGIFCFFFSSLGRLQLVVDINYCLLGWYYNWLANSSSDQMVICLRCDRMAMSWCDMYDVISYRKLELFGCELSSSVTYNLFQSCFLWREKRVFTLLPSVPCNWIYVEYFRSYETRILAVRNICSLNSPSKSEC